MNAIMNQHRRYLRVLTGLGSTDPELLNDIGMSIQAKQTKE
jgi:hypothetical protein